MESHINVLDELKIWEEKKEDILEKINKSENHKNAIEIVKKYELAQPCDYLRSCGTTGYTDFALRKIEENISDDSKYIVARPIGKEIVYLEIRNFKSILEDMREFYEYKNRLSDTNKTRERIYANFKKNQENILIYGDKDNQKRIILDSADVSSLVERSYYRFDKNHLNIQAQVAALGVYFGYKSKVARNDKNKRVKSEKLNEFAIATMSTLRLQDIQAKKSKEKIDYIDVIWSEKKHGNIVLGVEIEFKNDWPGVINRLGELSMNGIGEGICLVVSANKNDINLLREHKKASIGSLLKWKLAHISVQELINILKLRDKHGNEEELKNIFFKSIKFV